MQINCKIKNLDIQGMLFSEPGKQNRTAQELDILTVTVRAGSRLPKSSKMLITAEMSTKAQK